MALTESVTLDLEVLNTPTLVNHCDVYNSQKFVLQKPKWIEDTQVSTCNKCCSRFTQLKRRHHCRQCGKIYCNTCCKDKMILPHLDYSGPERVCEDCKPLVNIFYLAFSVEIQLQQEGAKAFNTMCQSKNSIRELLCTGGVLVLIHLGKRGDNSVRMEVLKALNHLMAYSSLHTYMAELGAIKVICRILTESEIPELQRSGLEVLLLFVENYELKNRAFDHGALPPLLHMCSSHHDDVALLAVTCLSSVIEHPDTHDALVHSNVGNALACLLSMVHSTHEQVQEMLLKILANISYGNDYNREKIMQEDLYNGGYLCQVINSRPLRHKAMCHATCVIANIVATSSIQGGQRDQLLGLCNLLSEMRHDEHLDLLRQISRGIANCVKVANNCDMVIEFIPKIIETCLRSTDHTIRYHGFRITVSLLKFVPEQTIQVLHRNGSEEFLRCLCGTQDTLDTILNASLSRVQMLMQPDRLDT